MALPVVSFFRVLVRFLDGAEETFEKWGEIEAGILATFAAGSPEVEFVKVERVNLGKVGACT